ncbi:MAG TPA: hypothetical protein VIF02_14395 [Methylocella sp.]|jgi:uncharacterized protein YaaQ
MIEPVSELEASATEIPLTQSFSEAELLTVGGLLQEGNIVAGYGCASQRLDSLSGAEQQGACLLGG